MDLMETLEKLINDMSYAPNPETQQQGASQLANWFDAADPQQIIEFCTIFITTKTNERVLFFAANSLRMCIRTRWKECNIGMFDSVWPTLVEYISNHQQNISQPSFVFLLLALSDFAILTGDQFSFAQILSSFPANIQIPLCTDYFIEFNTTFFKNLINEPPSAPPPYMMDFAQQILQAMPLSLEWINLYHNVTYSLGEYDSILVYMPRLQEATGNLEYADILTEHITKILNFPFNHGPEPYRFALLDVALRLSINLRAAIEQNPQDFSLADKLILLWTGVFDLEDENGFYFREQFDLMSSVLQEFLLVAEVLFQSFQLSEDLELWPTLVENLLKYCQMLSNDNPLQPFAIPAIEFVILSLNIGIQVLSIADKVNLFYDEAKDVLDPYFASPRVNYPSILLVIGVLINHMSSGKPKFPSEIAEVYFANFEQIDAPPQIQIFFATQCIQEYGVKLGPAIVNILYQYFADFPYECSQGIYQVLLYYPELITPDTVEPLHLRMTTEPDIEENVYIIPDIITLLISLPSEQANPYYESICQVLVQNLSNLHQSEDTIRGIMSFFELFNTILTYLYHLSSQWTKTGSIELFQAFGQKVFAELSMELGEDWFNPDEFFQKSLTNFVAHFLSMGLVEDPSFVATWLNQIVTIQAYPFHLDLIVYLKDYVPLLENIPQLLAVLPNPDDKNKYIRIIIVTFKELALQWDDSLWYLFPPEMLLQQLIAGVDSLRQLALSTVAALVDSPLVSIEFKKNAFQAFLQSFHDLHYTQSSLDDITGCILVMVKYIESKSLVQIIASSFSWNEEIATNFLEILNLPSQSIKEKQEQFVALRTFLQKLLMPDL